MRDRIIKNYKVAAARLRDATQLAADLADATRNFLLIQMGQEQRFDYINPSLHGDTLYVDPQGKASRFIKIPKRVTLRDRIVRSRDQLTHRVETFAAIFEAAEIIRHRKSAERQEQKTIRQQQRQQKAKNRRDTASRNAQDRRDRVTRMAQNFAARYGRT